MLQFLWAVLTLLGMAAMGIIGALITMGRGEKEQPPGETEFRVEYDTPDFSEKAGFQIIQYPDHEIAEPSRNWLINNDTAEIEYNIVPGNSLQLRVAETDQLRIPEEYTIEPYESVSEYEIDGIQVKQYQSPGRRGMVTWSNNGFDYVIVAPDPEMNLLSGMADDFVRNTEAVQS